LRDERAALPIGSFHNRFGVTLSLPSVVGRKGVLEVFEPELSPEEKDGLQKSAANLREALERVS
jgi:L-lactate dehydrogenase